MLLKGRSLWLFLFSWTLLPQNSVLALSLNQVQQRRDFFKSGSLASAAALLIAKPSMSIATTDCVQDCFKNCQILAPKNSAYCTENCQDYCEQPDREDGLSGSISSKKGETGILGFGTVPKGEDKPPTIRLPGLDFTSGSGKKLIGY